jgi:sterol desaturase/sphingolipid hydroxylase (fatty acid hydroxylase superfamily)
MDEAFVEKPSSHHYKDEHKGFGVSTTIWDRLFGTMFDLKRKKKIRQKCRN